MFTKGKPRFFWTGLLFVSIVLVAGWSGQAQSQEKYPTRAIEIIVTFAPGGGTDTVTRLAATFLSKKWGVPVNVVNKPGGNTLPACMDLYSAPPNGYTLLADCQPSSSMLGVVVKDLPFKVLDRTLIAISTTAPMAFIVPSSTPFKNMHDVAAEAKRDPENFTWVSLGGVSGQDFITRQFFKAIGVDVMKTKPVMAKGGSQATTLTAGGHVKLGSTNVISARAAIKAGLIRLLAVARERNIDFPEVPTTAEAGYPTANVLYWNGFSGPPKLPAYIVDTWDKALQEMAKDPEYVSSLVGVGFKPIHQNSREMREVIVREIEEVSALYDVK